MIDRLRKRIDDAGVTRLVRAYLNAGIMDGGVVVERHMGTPQGGPLSPLLANVLLDEVDKALEGPGADPHAGCVGGVRSAMIGPYPDAPSMGALLPLAPPSGATRKPLESPFRKNVTVRTLD